MKRTLGIQLSLAWVSLVAAALTLAFALSACGGDDAGKAVKLGGLTANDHGTTDAKGKTSIDFEVDSFYYSPSFIRGNPGQKLTLKVSNDSKATHNVSIKGANVDTDIASEGKAEVEVTFPQTGVLLFFCKYHTGQGMNGELLAGDAQIAAPAAAGVPTAGAATSGGSYGY